MARNSIVLPVLAAVILGLGAAVAAQHWMNQRMKEIEAQNAGGVPVLVARSEIAFGEKIVAEQLRIVGWPSDSVPDDALSNPDEAIGKIARQRLVTGEVLLHSRIADMGAGNSLATLISPNHRAVTVRVNDVIGVAGFLLPGSRVDVLATRMLDNRRAESRTLMQNVKVLAVDQTARTDKDQPVVVRAVTLETEPRQAEDLARATQEGTVQLALRNPDDLSVSAAPAAPAAKPSRRRVWREPPVILIRGAGVTETRPPF